MRDTSYGKKYSNYKKWAIYFNGETYYGFLPETSPKFMDTPEWEDDTLVALKEFIDCY